MNLLHRITGHLETRRKQAAIHGALARLEPWPISDWSPAKSPKWRARVPGLAPKARA